MVDKRNRKINKNNRRAIGVLISFFIIISGAYVAYAYSDVHETVKGVSANTGSESSQEVASADITEEPSTEIVSKEENTENTSDTSSDIKPASTADSTAPGTSEATDGTVTQGTTEGTTDKTTEKTTDKAEANTTEATADNKTTETTGDTTSEASTAAVPDDVRNNPVFSENNTSLPDIVDVPCTDWYDSRYFDAQPLQGTDYFDKTVFIGDSRTESLAYYAGFDNVNAFAYKGLNVGELETERCISLNGRKYTVYEAVAMTKYENYYISFGINELGWVYLDVFTEDISKLVDLIYSVNPKANVYIAGVVPVSKSVSDTDEVFNKANVEKFNNAIIKLCHDREDVIYIDYAAAVRDAEGYLPEEGTVDGKHCTGDYSRRIMEYILLHTYKHK